VVVALEEITPQEAVQLGAESLGLFGRLFFPRTFRQESPAFHKEMDAALYSPSRYNAFMVFRDGAKTTRFRVYTAQRISYGISRTIMYTSGSQIHSIMSLRWLKRQVMYNTKWAQTFGLRKGEKWTDEWLEIYHGVDEMPITVLAMGITGQIRGFNPDDFRPDLIILDDVLNEENTATDEQRKKTDALIFGALVNSLAPATEAPLAKVVFGQTPFDKRDAIHTCLNDPMWNGLKFGIFDDKGSSRWEERWPTKTMKEEKEAAIRRGQYSLWMREKECTIVSSEYKAIDVRRFRFWDILPEYMDVIIAIDPASSDSKDADDNVVGTLGFRGMDVYLLAYKISKGTMPDMCAAHFFEQALTFRPLRAAVESISYQRTLAWYIEQESIKRRVFIPVSRVQDKRSKANRIMGTIPGISAYGHFYIHPSMTEFIEQADDYDPQVKDQPDDILDMVAIGIIDYNPALHQAGLTIDGEAQRVDDDYGEPLRMRGAP